MQQQPSGHSDHATKHQHQDMGSSGLQLAEQLQQQLAGLELLAEAVSLLATGQADAAGAAAASEADAKDGGSSSFSFTTGGAAAGAATTAAGVGGSGQETLAGPGSQLLRLRRLLQTGQVGRKMEWFDPVLLQKMVSEQARAAHSCPAVHVPDLHVQQMLEDMLPDEQGLRHLTLQNLHCFVLPVI
jgi:hypothetical protein